MIGKDSKLAVGDVWICKCFFEVRSKHKPYQFGRDPKQIE